MRWALFGLATTLCAAILVGCSIGGSWRVVATDPPGTAAPVSVVTFGPNHNYTATWYRQGKTHTGVGRYHWSITGLEMTGADKLSPPVGARIRLDGKLVLTYKEGGTKTAATLEKVGK